MGLADQQASMVSAALLKFGLEIKSRLTWPLYTFRAAPITQDLGWLGMSRARRNFLCLQRKTTPHLQSSIMIEAYRLAVQASSFFFAAALQL